MVEIRRHEATNLFLVADTDPSKARFAVVVDPADTMEYENLHETWGDARYAFFPPTNAEEFLSSGATLWTVFQAQPDIRIGWFRDPNSPTNQIRIPADATIDSPITNDLELEFRNYELNIPQGTRLGFGNCGFSFSFGSLPVGPRFRRGGFGVRVQGDTLSLCVVDGEELPVSRFEFSLSLESSAAGVPDDFDRLDIGLRYFRRIFDYEREVEQIADPNQIVSRRFSVFNGDMPFVPSGSVPVRAYLDFFHPVARRDPDTDETVVESYLEFDRRLETLIGCSMRTSHGHHVVVAPSGEGIRRSRLLLVDRPTHATTASEHYYLSPSGEYVVEKILDVSGAPILGSRANRLVCGNSGLEYVFFSLGDTLSFVPGQNAFYTMPEPPRVANGSPISGSRRLTGKATTSWLQVIPHQEDLPEYRAQPDEAPLYTPLPKDPDIDPSEWPTEAQDVFQYQQLTLKCLPAEEAPAFPLVPADGFRPAVSNRIAEDLLPAYKSWIVREYLALESLVLQDSRREVISSISGGPPSPRFTSGLAADGEPQDAVTPAGLLVKLNPSQRFRFETLRLAKSESAAGRSDQFVEFHDVFANQSFVSALQRNRLFAVMSKTPDDVNFDNNDFQLLSWLFSIAFDRTKPTHKRPLLIFKLYENKSFVELAQDSTLWPPGLFVPSDSVALLDYIERIRRKRADEQASTKRALPLYKGIHDKLHDPNWNGILAINLEIAPQSLPEALQGLVVGINLDEFLLDHLGFNATRYEGASSGQIDFVRTSAFALLDYEAPEDAEPAGTATDAFQFLVKEVKALFEQSALRQFSTKVELGTNKVFKQDTKSETSKVELLGSYEQKDGIDTYTFAYTGNKQIEFPDGVTRFVDDLTFHGIQLSAAVPPGPGDKVITTTFSISGTLGLGKTLTRYLCVEGVGFRDLVAEFKFRLPASGDPELINGVDFQPGLLSFDLSKSQKCSRSILSYIPLDLRQFFFNLADSFVQLPKLGFLPLSVDGGSVEFDYGFSFDLDLGSLGALVPSLKDFKAEMFLGWQVDTPQIPVLGMKLPEGRMELGIQGVIKLIIGHFAVCIEGREEDPYYAIAMLDCNLNLLGYSIPDEDQHFNLFLFPNPDNPLGSRVGWFAGLFFGDGEEEFVGLGQRLLIDTGADPPKFDSIVESLKRDTRETGGTCGNLHEELDYSGDNEWTIGFDLQVVDSLKVGAIFNDPHLYALKVDILELFAIEVVYRKITEDLGVYATEIRLPDAVRQIELGAASLTLPIIGLEVYTNGDFRVDLGFPFQLEFSRCFQLQIFPFIGKGGFYVGRLLGRTSNLLPGIPAEARVAVLGLGLSIGLGKEMTKGIFSFGVSVSVYGVLEGALGYERNNGDIFSPDAYALVGRVGVIGILFGSVDFGIVKASVHIVVEIGMPFRIQQLPGQSFQISVPGIEANVSVRVEVVIKTIKIFGKKIKISITFSYRLHLRLDFPIEFGGGRAITEAAPSAALLEAAEFVTLSEIPWVEDKFTDLYLLLEA